MIVQENGIIALTAEDFEIAACTFRRVTFSDEELARLVEVHRCMWKFFRLREEKIMAGSMFEQAAMYDDMLTKRKEKQS